MSTELRTFTDYSVLPVAPGGTYKLQPSQDGSSPTYLRVSIVGKIPRNLPTTMCYYFFVPVR